MTLTNSILSKKYGKDVCPGELITVPLDLVLGNDITAPVAIAEFRKTGRNAVYDRDKVVIVLDHFTPNKDIKAAEQCKTCREFAREMKLTHFYDVGNMGIEHALIPELGLAKPGDVIIGADSHTCTYGAVGAFSTGIGSTDMAAGMATGEVWLKVPSAILFRLHGKFREFVGGKDLILHIIGMIGVDGALYKSMEFTGDIGSLSMDDRFTVCNMGIEAGAKNAVFEVDNLTRGYMRYVGVNEYEEHKIGDDGDYERIIDIDLSAIEPTVALPHLPENTKPISQIGKIEIDQVVIGSCTNGRLSDLAIAAKILDGKQVSVRTIVFPATQKVYLDALKLGYIEIFIRSGCAVSTPTCGPCLGGHSGVLASGERCLATTNRNFVGRMGHPSSEVYLASPAVAAASAVAGYITMNNE